ncbi:MAG: ATP12 family protein [Pseudomonadota bacterium]
MTEWKARRFWTSAEVSPSHGGFGIALDNRAVQTPGKQPLVVPTRTMAETIAAEWDAQDDIIDPATMPFTRLANSALEKVAPQRSAVAEMLAEYGDSDLTCYRAGSPATLVARQEAAWDPLLDWAAERYGGRLITVTGVMHSPQPAQALAALATPVHAMDAFELTGFHELVALSGSLIIGLAARAAYLPIDELWARSRIDESWQQEQWGTDEEAAQAAAKKAQDFFTASKFLSALTD